MTKRPRKTRQEMIAFRQAQLDKLIAQEEGSYRDESENAVLKALKKRLRNTNTELRAAGITLNGTEVRSSIQDKIAHTQRRMDTQLETQANAEVFVATLPFDVERLEALIAACEAGEDVEFPTDLTRLSKDEDRTDEEHEAAYIANEEAAEES